MKKRLPPLMLTTVVWLVSLSLAGDAAAATPVLTGRWGDTRVPQQLAFDYPTKKSQALVIVTFSTQCPLVRRLVPNLNELQQQYDAQGIQLIALFPNSSDDLPSIAEYALDLGLVFPVFKDDPDNPWYKELGITKTPEVVVLDTREGFDQKKIVYRGQVNGMWFGGGQAEGKQNYLADALASFAKGEKIALSETAASGCEIAKTVPKDLSKFAGVTYHKEIAQLLADNCVSCHREGEAGAELFGAFDSYENVAAMSAVMLSRMEQRIMPPWHGITDAENGLGGFQHDSRLSDDQINLFRAWVAAECPVGNEAEAPAPRTWPGPDDWAIGKGDFVYEMEEPYVVPKFRLDEYQFYRIKANYSEDRYIQAIELKPGNKAIVHHIGAIIGPHNDKQLEATKAMFELYGLTGDQVKKVGDYIAGDPFNARTYPEGYALRLPAGHDIFFEMHYTPTGREELPDVSKMSIRWATQKPEHVLETKVFNRKDLRLRPHEQHSEKASYHQFPTDVLIYALGPHMHFRGKDFTLYKATNPGTPEEKRELILKVPAYDFNWQRTYEFVKPIQLKAGDALYSVTHFDNSHYNPNNPDPEKLVRFGLKSEQEMLNLRVKYEEVDFGKAY
jgi:thiol-disulfide isomerase/thioredoxin